MGVVPSPASPAPPDPREWHGYEDHPRHTALIVVGGVLCGVFAIAGFLSLFIASSPSEPCPPGAGPGACGPEPMTFAAVGLGFLISAAVCAGWSAWWSWRDGRYRFQAPPDWPTPPQG